MLPGAPHSCCSLQHAAVDCQTMQTDAPTNMPLLHIKDFSLQFLSQGEKVTQVLEHINLRVSPGETCALVGESGSGKSVTALSILRLVDEISRIRTEGSIQFAGQDINSLSKQAMQGMRGNRIAMIFQEPMTSLNPVYSVGMQLMEPLRLHQKLTKNEAYTRALELLVRTGIEDAADRMESYPHQLSGGQRQRVIIAMALACGPELLIADEPTTALDVTIQEQILALIQDVQQEFGMAMLLITHDLTMVSKIAHRVSIMHRGKIVEEGPTERILTAPQKEYTRHLLAAMPKDRQTPRQGGAPLLQLQQVSCSFPLKSQWHGFLRRKVRSYKAVDTVNLSIKRGTTLGLVGESGSGKSTLAMCILQLVECQGTIVYYVADGQYNLTGLSAGAMRSLRRDLQIVLQDPFSSLSPRLNVGQIVEEGLLAHKIGKTRAERLAMVEEALRDVELDPVFAHRYPHEFSGGQRQRIAIARALVLRPKLLILDEPTSALDVTIQKQVLELLRRLQSQYELTYIFITHDLKVVRSLADQVAVMQRGKIVEQGRADQIFAHPQEAYTKRLFQAAFR